MSSDDNYLKSELYDLIKKDDRIFDFIQDGSLDGLWYWDLENPENEWMSPKFWTVLGYNPDEMPHKSLSWQNIINQDDLKIAVEMVNEHLSNPEKLYDQIVRYKHKDGSTVFIRCRGMAIRNKDGNPIRMIGAHQDITLQKKAEENTLSKVKIFEKLNEYTIEISSLTYDELFPRIAKRIKEFFEVEEVVISLYDAKNSEIVTKYTTFSDEVNNKLSKYLGGRIIGLRTPLSKEGYNILVSRTISKVDSLHELTFGKIPDTIGKLVEKVFGIGWFIGIALMQNNNLVGTIVLVGKNDKELPDTTLLETFIKISTTELARKIAELELIESEDRYRSLLTNLETGVVVHNQDTSIVLSNARASELLGLSIEQMRGKEAFDPHWKFIYEDNSPVPLNDYPVMRILNSKKAIKNQVYGVYRKPDDVVWLMVNGFPSFVGGEISEIIISLNDITELRLANQALLKAKQEVEESEQRFKALHNASFGGIAIHDKGIILDCNQGLSDMFGYSHDELIGMDGLLLIAPQDRDFVMNKIVAGYEKPYEAFGIRKNGEQFPIRLEARNVPYNGKQVRTVEFRDLTEQKVAEIELLLAKEKAEENEQMFKSLIENAPDGVVIVDINGNIKYGSPNSARHFGYNEIDILGHSGSEFTHPDDIPMVLKTFEDMIINPSVKPKLIYRFRRKEGEYRWIETTFTNQLSNKYINGFILNFSDITERKESELLLQDKSEEIAAQNEELNMSNQELLEAISRAEYNEANVTAIIEGTQHSIWAFDRNYDILYINHVFKNEYYQTFGIKLDIGSNLIESLPEFLRPFWKPRYDRVLANEHYTVEDVVETEYGNIYIQVTFNPIIKNGEVIGGSCFGSNITERKQAEREIIKAKEKIEQSEENLRFLFDNMIQGVVYHKPSGEIVRANDAAARILGLTTDQLFGRTSFDPRWKAIHEDKTEYLAENHPVMITIKTKEPVKNEIMGVFIPERNKYSWINVNSIPKFDDKGELVQVVVTFEDITEMKNAKEKAEESDRLKSAFLANMSHEIRTPMNGILGFAQLLKEPDLSGDEQLEFISIIEKSGKRMLNIINDIIDISKIEAGLMKLNIQESNINDQIDYIHSFFQPEANYKNIQLNCKKELPSNLAFICTDREKVFAIFTNLVKNAIKFTDHGNIEFGYNLKSENQPMLLQFYVKDTGIGIPKSRQKAIFERFIQADITDAKAYQGAGLGLAITKAYVEMLGGNIWVESQEGQGSTFYFTLPYSNDNNCEPGIFSDAIKTDKSMVKKLKILIAEDDKISEKVIEKFISEYSTEVLKVNNGLNAIEVCKNNPDIDLIMMDIQMPEVDGYNATKQIREFNKDVIIIAQTAYGLAGDREKALEAGCSDYLSKPIEKDELKRLIKKYFS